jgi:hypothetical protein
MTSADRPFANVPRTAAGHFALNASAAIFQLLGYARRVAESRGSTLDALFERFPFLADSFDEMRGRMPEDIAWDDVSRWWTAELAAWERECDGHLPLRALSEHCALSFTAQLAFVTVGLVE